MKSYKAIVITAATAVIISVSFATVHVYSTGKNKRIIYKHCNEYHQVIHHLFDKKIFENQLIGEILTTYPPTKVSSHDNYLTLQYFKNNDEQEDCCIYYSYYVHIIVRDNKLVKAFATEGLFSEIDYVFFDVLSDSSEDDYWDSRVNNAVSKEEV